MRRFNMVLIVAGLAVSAACATPAEADAPAQVFEIDNEHTHIVWGVERFGFTDTVGTFADVSGSLLLVEDNPEASQVSAVIALAGLRSDLPQREDIVRGPHWLNADQFPTIEFKSSSVTLLVTEDCPETCARVDGEMTLKGITAPLSLDVRLNKVGMDPVTKKQAAGFSATGAFQRSVFGVTTAIGPIGDTVEFRIEALAIAE